MAKKRRGMYRKVMAKATAGLMATAMVASSVTVQAETTGDSAENLTVFEQAFKNPDNDAKPYVRWWIAPGRMTEEGVREQMQSFAEGGFGGVELQTLEMSKYETNSDEWNTEMKWILQAGIDFGIKVDMTLGQLWPIATPEITDPDDERAEQQIWDGSTDFTASEENMTYTAGAYVYPEAPTSSNPWFKPAAFDENKKHELIAITAAKKNEDGSYDPDSAVTIQDENGTVEGAAFNEETGELSWTAPEAGDWTVFYFYQQASGKTTLMVGELVIDYMSADATQAVIDNWDAAMDRDPELKALYEQNGGSVFGDSFELSSDLWTPTLLETFKENRGYDLTPYLPALKHNFANVNSQIQEDVYETMTELLSENHMKKFSDWAKTHNMDLRYQGYSSAGSSVFELTQAALNTDRIEAESYAMSGDTPDAYRQLSGAVNMRGDHLYSAEAAEIGNDDWRETWTAAPTLQDGSENPYPGFMHYAYRLYAGGVNKAMFHGSTYHFTDTSGMTFAPAVVPFPGYSAMSGMNYGNEWDNKTPMWENVDIMLDSLARTQMVLQQGQGDVDLAFYRNQYGKGNVYSDITAVEQAGYTYDYVTPALLNMDNAVTGDQDGNTVLAADGPSYKAIVIEPRAGELESSMPIETARKILEYAKNGLPVVFVGGVPSTLASYSSEDGEVSTEKFAEEQAEFNDIMDQICALDNVGSVDSRDALPSELAALGVAPDAKAEIGTGDEARMRPTTDIYFNHRTTDDAELYFAYNEGSDFDGTVTLKGDGVPYLLDPWSGDVTPIAEYTVDEDGVTINAEIENEDALLVAIAPEGWSSKSVSKSVTDTTADKAVYDEETGSYALQTTTGGEVSATLSDGSEVTLTADAPQDSFNLTDWSMVLNQWTEGDSAYEHNVEPTEEYDLSEIGLVPWYDIDENLTNAAGVAEYKTSFELEKGWEEGQGAYLDFTEMSDVGRLIVNGTEVPMDQVSLHTDIGKYLVAGTNTITVEVTSNMSNLASLQATFRRNGGIRSFGIIGDVTVTPYTQVAESTPDTPDNPDNPNNPDNPDTPNNPDNPSTPEDPSNGGNGGTNNGGNSGNAGTNGNGQNQGTNKKDDNAGSTNKGGTTKKQKASKTGDHANAAGWLVLVATSAGLATVVIRRKRLNR